MSWVQYFRDGLVRGKLYGGKRNGHSKSGGIGNIKGPKTLVTEDGFGALEDGGVGGAMHLHPLFDDWFRLARQDMTSKRFPVLAIKRVHERITGDCRTCTACCYKMSTAMLAVHQLFFP